MICVNLCPYASIDYLSCCRTCRIALVYIWQSLCDWLHLWHKCYVRQNFTFKLLILTAIYLIKIRFTICASRLTNIIYEPKYDIFLSSFYHWLQGTYPQKVWDLCMNMKSSNCQTRFNIKVNTSRYIFHINKKIVLSSIIISSFEIDFTSGKKDINTINGRC